MTNIDKDSSFLSSEPLRGKTISDFLNLPELIGLVAHNAISQLNTKKQSVFEQCRDNANDQLVAVAARFDTSRLDAAVNFFGSEHRWENPHVDKASSILIIDRIRINDENKKRFEESIHRIIQSKFATVFLLVKTDENWQPLPDFLDTVTSDPDEELKSESMRSIQKKAFRPERYKDFFSKLHQKTGLLIESKTTVLQLFQSLGDLSTATSEFDANILKGFLSNWRSFSELSLIKISTELDVLPWRTVKKIQDIRERYLSPESSNPAALPNKIEMELCDLSQAAQSLEQVKNEAKNLDVILPTEVIGFETLASFLTIQEELTKFFLSLPSAKLAASKEVASTARTDKADLLASISYRGWKLDQILKLSVEEFCNNFKNHPKFRTLCAAILAFELGQQALSQPLSELSYRDSFCYTWIRELRKLREGSKVYIPSAVSLFCTVRQVQSIKESLLSFLNFYRAQIVVYLP